MIGSSVSHYKVTDKLGEGGMGEVWRAEDTKLGRDVALKMLPEAVAGDPDRLARFEREARVLASLNHPNIAGIFGLEEDDGTTFLVMEVAEGETLAERIQRGRVAPEEVARIGAQIAEGLEAAHQKGVVHRDLKPANVKVTEDGRVKILDFGLAKALVGDPESGSGVDLSMSPTLTQAMGAAQTGVGVLLGTAGYMSPEQARAQPVDRRTDIWAFGCVLYEMLTGRRTFTGDTATDILGAIVHKEPELDELPATLSPRLRRLIERCLRKDADRRLQSIGDARVVLQDWLENPDEAQPVVAEAPSGAKRWMPLAAAAGVAGVLGLLAGALFLGGEDAAPQPTRRFEQVITSGRLFTDFGPALGLSPDGRHLAFNSFEDGQLLHLNVRALEQSESKSIAEGFGSGTFALFPFFSPDGEWVAYFTGENLTKAQLQGGAPIDLVAVDRASGGDWSPSGRIVYAHDGSAATVQGLYIIPASGGEREVLTEARFDDTHEHHNWPQWLPGERAVVFSVDDHSGSNRIEVIDVETRERKVLHRGGAFGRYVDSGGDTGYLLFVNDGALFALSFDPDRLEASGSPMPVLQGVSAGGRAYAQFSVSDDGLLAYVEGEEGAEPFPIAWAGRNGSLETMIDTPGIYGGPVFSPSGDRLAVARGMGDNWDIWVHDLERGVPTRLTFGDGYDADIVWSPDGQFIAFTSDRADGVYTLYRKRSDGSGEAEQLLEPGAFYFPSPLAWSDNRLLFVAANDENDSQDLFFLDLETGETEVFFASPRRDSEAVISPDGRYVAHSSDESGTSHVYVRAINGEGKWQISVQTGAQPQWAADGRELYYRNPDGLMVVDTDTAGTFRAGRPQFLFRGPLGDMTGVQLPGYIFPDYDVAPDGRFVVFQRREEGEEGLTRIRFVTGWFAELRRLTEGSGS